MSNKSNKKNSFFRFVLKSMIALVFLEVIVFNFNAYSVFISDAKEEYLLSDRAVLTNAIVLENGSIMNQASGEVTIEFLDVDRPVKTLFIDVDTINMKILNTVQIHYSDETSVNYRTGNVTVTIIRGDERSQIIPCHFSGDVGKLKLIFNLRQDERLLLNQLIINRPIPFHFSLLRILVGLSVLLLYYASVRSNLLKRSVEKNKILSYRIADYITIFMIILAFFITEGYNSRSDSSLLEDFRSTSGNQITQELVDAFEAGQFELLQKPSDELLALENPYDWGQRNKAKVNYLWDHGLYDGSYYSYFGIAPVVLVFMPYHLLTGFYFPSNWFVFIFSAIGILYLSKIYMIVLSKWFWRLRTNMAMMGLLVLQASSGIWFSVARPLIYEISIASGFAFLTMGIYYLLASNVLSKGKISALRVFLATTMLSLAVLSRPTLALYCIATLPALYLGFSKLIKEQETSGKRRILSVFGYVAASLLPYMVFGGIQMFYNYTRFDSIFEFGVNYYLTVNDLTHMEFHIQQMSVNLFNYLLAMPSLLPKFPFVFSNFQRLNLNGYSYVDNIHLNAISIGVLFRGLPIFAYVFSRKAYQKIAHKQRRKVLVLLGLFSVVAPIAIIVTLWKFGYAIRYSTDFSWQLVLGALAIIFTLYVHSNNKGVNHIVTWVFALSVMLSLLINFSQVYSFIHPQWLSEELNMHLYTMERLFEFWR